MNLLLSGWSFAGMAVAKLSAQEMAALIVLAGSLVVYRTFRERYLLIWITGWAVYLISKLSVSLILPAAPYAGAISQGEFMLALGLFATAVLLYTHTKRLVLPLLLITLTLVGFAVARELLWPDLLATRISLEVAYRLVALMAAIHVVRYRWGRFELGPWLL